ncbi:uncharacterized protein B0H18DRAFT_869878 [Fomitopsis serialis]|uniref:uncharacterized protein n=1 Tax=Fomitopsis serialis TaxID=139415 RepID=UPI0020071EAF|nr:uncharacterized protein B0H18DRAFT_869878 [Neoantrodia serialis]KAH9934327.1 hypothetical protein B0H18DRAFT_869878 [Neoantrodia serialis]
MGCAGSRSYKLGEFAIDEHRPIKIVCVGAGFSGIVAAIRQIPDAEFSIYERCAGVGGTWFTNRFPGLACDIPSHCYQYTFEAKADWSSFYAPGAEIQAYLQSVVDKYQLMRYIKLQHEVVHAQYDQSSGKWLLRIRRQVDTADGGLPAYEEITDTADVFITAVGIFSKWTWPDIEGLKEFGGELIHSADFGKEHQPWQDVVKTWGDKRIGVVGVGSSAIQIVPALQPHVAHLINYVRGKTWICPPFSRSKILELLQREPDCDNFKFTEVDKEKFRDEAFCKLFRYELETDINSLNPITYADGATQKQGREFIEAGMRTRLAKKPWIADHLTPDFGVACRRLTSGPGYLEALCEDNVDFVASPIKKITRTGVETEDGIRQDLDILLCATGYDYSFQLPFPVVGRSGITIQERWAQYPSTYMSLCTDGFPNWFMALGPNSGVSSGSQLAVIEHQVDYMIEATKKLQRGRLKSIDVKPEVVRDFDEYVEHYFPKTVFSQTCRSWYKGGKERGRVVALWPGSSLHNLRALQYPRWEDFNYEPLDDTENRLHWFGDGQTHNEKTMSGDRAWYLNDDEMDYPPSTSQYSQRLQLY